MQMHELVDAPIVERKTPMLDVSGFLTLALGSGFVSFVGMGLLALAVGVTVKLALGFAGFVILAFLVIFSKRVWQAWFQTETVRSQVPQLQQPVKEMVGVEISEPHENRMQFLDLPGGAVELRQLASGVLAGRTFAESEWTGAGRPYARSEFRELRGQLLERGLLSWRNEKAPSQGVQLTRVGQAVFARIAEARTHAHARGGGQFPAAYPSGQGREGGERARLT